MKGDADASPIRRDALAQLNAAAKSVMATDGVGVFLEERLVPAPINVAEVGPVKREFAVAAVAVEEVEAVGPEASKKDESSFRVRFYLLEILLLVLDLYLGNIYTHIIL